MVMSSREYFSKQFQSLNPSRVSSKRISAISNLSFDLRELAPALAIEAMNNPHLSDQGKRAARYKALKELFVENARSRNELKRIRDTAQAEMDALALPTLDKGDIVSEMREAEMRAIVRAMPQEQRDHLSKMSPTMAAAIVRAPPELSGVSRSVHAQIRGELIETAHPEKVAALRAELEGLSHADLIVKDTDKALTESAAFLPGEDRAFLAEVESSLDKPKPAVEDGPNDLDAIIAAHRRRRRIPAA